jgi:hypothetical protein
MIIYEVQGRGRAAKYRFRLPPAIVTVPVSRTLRCASGRRAPRMRIVYCPAWTAAVSQARRFDMAWAQATTART